MNFMYPVSSAEITRTLRGCFREGFVYMYVVSFRFISKQRKTSNAVWMSSLIFWLQPRELRLSICFNTFRNFNRSLNKRRMSPAQTVTTEWTAEKCLDKRQTNPQTQARQPNKQMVKSASKKNCKKQFKQQGQQCRLKDDLIFNLRISREFRFTEFVYTVRDIPNGICKTASEFEKEILKIVLA